MIIVFYFLTAFILSRITIQNEKNVNTDVLIYILTNGVHTDLVLPIKNPVIEWDKKIKFSNIKSKDTIFNFIAFGWGDRGFYLETPEWKDLKISTALKATTGLSRTAMHTTFYKNMKIGTDCKEIKISLSQYERLVKYIDNGFYKDEKNEYVNIKTDAVYGKNDSFYEGNGSYSIFKTCNTWANDGLKYCGQKSCLWTIFDTPIFNKY